MAYLDFPKTPADQTPVNEFGPSTSPFASTNGATYVWVPSGSTGYWAIKLSAHPTITQVSEALIALRDAVQDTSTDLSGMKDAIDKALKRF